MGKETELQVVFTGTRVDAQFVKAYLEDNGINCLIKDPFRESVIAGWVKPGSQYEVKVLVENRFFITANYLVNKFYKENDSGE